MTSRAPLLPRLTAALVSALAVAAITQVATTLFFHATNGAVSAQLSSISSFFAVSSLVLVAVAAVLGLYRRWFITLPVALVITVIASLGGTVITYISAGNELTAEVWPSVFDTLRSNNLFFVVFGIIAIMTAGVAVWRAVLARSTQPRDAGTVALVRIPSSNLAEGELTHLERTPVDSELADVQWEKYVAALEAEGFTTVEVPAADGFADSVFIEDAVVILGTTAVITSPGAESRRGETRTAGNPRWRRRTQGRHHDLCRSRRSHQRRGHPPVPRDRRSPRLRRCRCSGQPGAAPEECGHRAARWHGHWVRAAG
jgi:dimethylargininase